MKTSIATLLLMLAMVCVAPATNGESDKGKCEKVQLLKPVKVDHLGIYATHITIPDGSGATLIFACWTSFVQVCYSKIYENGNIVDIQRNTGESLIPTGVYTLDSEIMTDTWEDENGQTVNEWTLHLTNVE